MDQYARIARMLTRQRGATAYEMQLAAGTTCVHKRLSDMKRKGWTITRKPVPGRNFGRYYGQAPV